jgi:putative ABC transport system permease protein
MSSNSLSRKRINRGFKVQKAVAAQLPEGVSVRVPTLRSQVAGESTTAIQRGLPIATIFSLILATFIIFNTFQMNVGERRRQLGICEPWEQLDDNYSG